MKGDWLGFMMTTTQETDLQILNSYGFYSITALTGRGETWLKQNVQGARDGVAHCDDSRLALDIFIGAKGDGLGVEAERV